MGLFDKWLRPDRQTEKKKFKPLEAAWANLFLRNISQINTTDDRDDTYIDKGYRMNPTVYSIVKTVSKNAGMAKWGVYKKGADGTKRPYNDVLLQGLLDNPNGLGTWNHLIQQAIGFKMLTGNVYFWGIEGSNDLTKGKVSSLYVLPSHKVQIIANESRRGIVGYNLDYFGHSADEAIPAEDILHIKDFNPDFDEGGDFLYGQSPLRAALLQMFSNNEASETARSYLLNQGPRGILAMQMDDQYGEMDESQVNALRSRFKQNHTGTKKAGELLVAPGKWDWVNIGSSSADLMLIEHYNLTQNDLCNIYGFPTQLLGTGETSFNNLEQAKKSLWTNVIIPILVEIRDGLNVWLASRYGRGICIDFDTSSIPELQIDRKAQSDAIQKLQGVVTINEARSFIGLAPIEGGEELYIFRQGVEDGKTENPSGSEGSQEDNEQAE